MSEEIDPVLVQRAVFGKQVEAFLNTDIGRYMVNRALDQKKDAQDLFTKVDCHNPVEVQKVQSAILVADAIVDWLQDAVADGIQALNLIEDRS